MELSNDFQEYILYSGLKLTTILTLIYVLSWRFKKDIWSTEITDGKIQRSKTGYHIYLVVFFLILTLVLIYQDLQLIELNPDVTQATLFVSNFLTFGLYCLFDLLVIDFIIYIRIRPRFMSIDGIEPNYNYLHHTKYFIRSLIFGGVFCFVASLISSFY